MPQKAMKCIVEIDLYVVTCPGTFLRDYEYAYINMEVMGLEARTKSVAPTFPLFFHECLKFEKTFSDCTDPGLVASMLKADDIIIELRQHTDYIGDGEIIAHCSSNTHDFLYPAISSYYGSGQQILLYKTGKFKPIRVTGEPVLLEFSTKTVIKEVPDYSLSEKSLATKEDLSKSVALIETSALKEHNDAVGKSLAEEEDKYEFVIRRKDDNVLSNRDFSTYVRPKPRRSLSPVRSSSLRRSLSPNRPKTPTSGNVTVESLPVAKYSSSLLNTSVPRHSRSITDPLCYSTISSLRYALDLAEARRHRSRYRTYTSPHIIEALHSSKRIEKRVDDLLYKKDLFNLNMKSDVGLDMLRESLREERNALNDAIQEADREAFKRSLNKTR